MYEFINKTGLSIFLAQLQNFFGFALPLKEAAAARTLYLLEIDYDNLLKFDTSWIVEDVEISAGYVQLGTVDGKILTDSMGMYIITKESE